MAEIIIHGAKLKEVLREDLKNALSRQSIDTLEIAEFYLFNLLQQFHNAEGTLMNNGTYALERPLAILLLEAVTGDYANQMRCLRQVGDTALMVAGFFVDHLHGGLMKPSYYVSVGQSAYGNLAQIHETKGAFFDLYMELATKFAQFAEAISLIAPWNIAQSDADLVRIYERWVITGNEALKDLLEKKGLIKDDEDERSQR